MRAKVTKAFSGRPDDDVQTRDFKVGDVVSGDLAKVAIDNKWAEETQEDARFGAEKVFGSNVTGTALEDFKQTAAGEAQAKRGGLSAAEVMNEPTLHKEEANADDKSKSKKK